MPAIEGPPASAHSCNKLYKKSEIYTVSRWRKLFRCIRRSSSVHFLCIHWTDLQYSADAFPAL